VEQRAGIAGPDSEFWDRVGVMSNPSPNKKNAWKTGYNNLYIRASKKILKINTNRRHVMLEAKGLEGGGLDFRCSVNNAELIDMVPASCRKLRPATPNIQKW
jgi:hypothetical protein